MPGIPSLLPVVMVNRQRGEDVHMCVPLSSVEKKSRTAEKR